jgi:hypothetical protein
VEIEAGRPGGSELSRSHSENELGKKGGREMVCITFD